MSDDKTDKRMSTGIGLFSDIRVHEITYELIFIFSYVTAHCEK